MLQNPAFCTCTDQTLDLIVIIELSFRYFAIHSLWPDLCITYDVSMCYICFIMCYILHYSIISSSAENKSILYLVYISPMNYTWTLIIDQLIVSDGFVHGWLGGASVVLRWCLSGAAGVPVVLRWCPSGAAGVSVVPRWCLSGAAGVSVVPRWCLSGAAAGVSVVLRWCLMSGAAGVSVLSPSYVLSVCYLNIYE